MPLSREGEVADYSKNTPVPLAIGQTFGLPAGIELTLFDKKWVTTGVMDVTLAAVVRYKGDVTLGHVIVQSHNSLGTLFIVEYGLLRRCAWTDARKDLYAQTIKFEGSSID